MAICVNYRHSEKKLRSQYHRKIRANEIEERIPLKQGLKPDAAAIVVVLFIIEERIPLKQGLKLSLWSTSLGCRKIEERIPLKQGLKQ